MKIRASLFVLMLALQCSANAQGSPISDPPTTIREPLLSPNEAVKLAENYLTQVKHLDKDKFRLGSVFYEYFSTIPSPPGVVRGWHITFYCVPEKLDCEYPIGISNARKPKIVLYPGP